MRVTADFNTEIFAVAMIYREGGEIRINYKNSFPPIFSYSSVLCDEERVIELRNFYNGQPTSDGLFLSLVQL
jgi:hypothetical protein